jgi:hypothetical protein
VNTVEDQTTTDGVARGLRPLARRLRAGAVLGLGLTFGAPAAAMAAQGDPTNPFVGHRQFIDCESGHTVTAPKFSSWYHYYRTRGANRKLLAKIARTPQVKWFTARPSDPVRAKARQVERYIANVDHPPYGGASCAKKLHYSSRQWQSPVPAAGRDPYVGDYPVLAFHALDDKRCGGDADPGGTYRSRIDAFVRELSLTYASPEPYKFWGLHPPPWARWRRTPVRPAAVILEPDTLGLMGARSHCVRGRQKAQALALIRYGVNALSAMPGVSVYIDAGAGDWLHVGEAVSLLRQAGVARTRGFAVNATHFDRTGPERRFGNAVARRLGKHYVLNTAENGRGKLPRRLWRGLSAGNATTCNPPNAGLGQQPTSRTGSRYADAFLWISRPGISSNGGNRCGRGPAENVWYQGQALGLARRAVFKAPAWPPKPF